LVQDACLQMLHLPCSFVYGCTAQHLLKVGPVSVPQHLQDEFFLETVHKVQALYQFDCAGCATPYCPDSCLFHASVLLSSVCILQEAFFQETVRKLCKVQALYQFNIPPVHPLLAA
jgi:hypothetical protein